jgi:hypothetical protein
MGAHMLSPELGAAVSGAQGAAKAVELLAPAGLTAGAALEALGVVALPLTAVTVALGSTMVVAANAMDNAESEARALDQAQIDLAADAARVQAAQDKANDSWKKFTDIATDAKGAVGEIGGTTSKAAEEGKKQAQEAKDAAAAQLRADADRVVTLRTAIAAAEELSRDEHAGVEARAKASASIAGNTAALEKATKTLKEHKDALKTTLDNIATTTEYNIALAESDDFVRRRNDELTKSEKAATKAREEAAANFDTYAEAAERAKARTDAINATVQGFIDDAKRATTETLADSEKIRVATEDRITAIGKEKIAKLLLAKTDEERTAIAVAAQRDVDAVTAEGAKKFKDAKDKETKAADDAAKKKIEADKKVADEARKAIDARFDAEANLAGGLSDLAAATSEAIGKKNKAAALEAFEISKGAAMAEAALDTEKAVANALALPLPPPFPEIAAAAAGAEGLAQEIRIANTPPPNYRDTPGVMEMQRGGVVQLAGGDKFLAARTTEDLRRQLDRMAGARREQRPAETRVIAVQSFDHRFTAKTLREHLKLPNPLSTAVRGTRRVGYDS